MKILSAGAEFSHVLAQTDMTKLIVALAIMRTLLKMGILLKGFLTCTHCQQSEIQWH